MRNSIDLTKNSFVITLDYDEKYTSNVVYCEMIGRDFRNRITFSRAVSLFEVFRRELATKIEEVLSRLCQSRQALLIDDFCVQLQECTLKGLRVFTGDLKNGRRLVTFRFKRCVGGLNAILRSDFGQLQPPPASPPPVALTLSVRERIAVETLVDIATPLFNLVKSSIGKDGPQKTDAVSNILERLRQRSDEIAINLVLLRRYIRKVDKEKSCDKREAVKDSGPYAALRIGGRR